MWLYRKYNADQPRDEQGRFAETGDDVDTTGSVVTVQRYYSGDPDIDRVTEALISKMEQAMEQVGPGGGPAWGSRVHATFADAVRAAGIPGVTVETSWLNGDIVRYGLFNSSRTDVVLHAGEETSGSVMAIWDLKTGGARLDDSRAAELRRDLMVGTDVPIIVLHAVRGTYRKSQLASTEACHAAA